jgi:hypothetical protein
MTDQEIRAKALELTIQTIALMPESKRIEQLSKGNPAEVIIGLSHAYQDYLGRKDPPN